MSLYEHGWNDVLAAAFDDCRGEGEIAARVGRSSGADYRLITDDGPRRATAAGKLTHRAGTAAGLPVVGDWVAATGADELRIERILPRRSALSRKVAGRRVDEQVVAANVDRVVVVMGLDGDYNLRRLERYLTAVWNSGATPVVLLNKTDLCDDVDERLADVERASPGVPVLAVSGVDGSGLDALRDRIPPRTTAVLVGSSGVGKSTLVNRLIGETVQRTVAVRDHDDRGRHTTTHRELFLLPHGGLLIDSPGIRELQLWGGTEGVSRAFDDIAELGDGCRFRDCTHVSEAGCAVLAAVDRGVLAAERLASFRELQRELRYLELRRDESARRIEKRKWRAIHKEMRRLGKNRGR